MKRLSLISIISVLSISLFAHPGHSHNEMSDGSLMGHLLWIIIPAVVLVVAFFALKKRKSIKE